MTNFEGTYPTKAIGPGATEPTAQTKAHEKNVAQRLTAVNALPRFPDRYSTEAETSAYDALDFPARNKIELDHRMTVNKNCRAVDNLEKHGLKKKTVRNGYGSSNTLTPLGVNAIEHRLELLPMELATDASGTRAWWLTINGTFIGSKTHRPPVSKPKLRSMYVFDAASVDRRFLFDGCGLLDEDGGLERLLSPREISARDEYAARLYLCMRWLGFSMPEGRTVKAAIQRLVAEVRGAS